MVFEGEGGLVIDSDTSADTETEAVALAFRELLGLIKSLLERIAVREAVRSPVKECVEDSEGMLLSLSLLTSVSVSVAVLDLGADSLWVTPYVIVIEFVGLCVSVGSISIVNVTAGEDVLDSSSVTNLLADFVLDATYVNDTVREPVNSADSVTCVSVKLLVEVKVRVSLSEAVPHVTELLCVADADTVPETEEDSVAVAVEVHSCDSRESVGVSLAVGDPPFAVIVTVFSESERRSESEAVSVDVCVAVSDHVPERSLVRVSLVGESVWLSDKDGVVVGVRVDVFDSGCAAAGSQITTTAAASPRTNNHTAGEDDKHRIPHFASKFKPCAKGKEKRDVQRGGRVLSFYLVVPIPYYCTALVENEGESQRNVWRQLWS